MNRFIFALVAIVFVYIVCKCVVIPRLAKRKQAQEKDSTPPSTGNPFPFAGYYPFPPNPGMGMVATAPAMSARKDVYFDCTLVPLDLDSVVNTDALSAVVGSNLLELRQRGIDVVAIQVVPLPERLLLCFSYMA